MGRLKTVKPRLKQLESRIKPIGRIRESRTTGRALQKRRLRVWSKNPHCAECGDLTNYPDGFHLDHIVALINGGQDTEQNAQVLCLECHGKKTKDDLRTFHGYPSGGPRS